MGRHPYAPAVQFDGGDLNCGNGLLLLIRRHIDPLAPGELLEILSTEISVSEDLPAWCRLTGNELVSHIQQGRQHSFLVSKGPFAGTGPAHHTVATVAPARFPPATRTPAPITQPVVPVTVLSGLPSPAPAPVLRSLAVMGVGSWPRPKWLLRALHDYLEGRLPEDEFQATADDAVRLAVDAQIRAGVDILTDGEQRRDNYASFVGARLDNCQLVPITDLLPYVDDPDHFQTELAALDVPAATVRHPAVFGPLGRSRALTVHEVEFLRTLTALPTKVALPGPYLLTRTMWMECISDRAYANREDLARDIVRVLWEEIHFLLAAGVALVQLDEPVLTEVVHGRAVQNRTFMCGALGGRGAAGDELEFAQHLINQVVKGLPPDRLALHVCRGNWSPDERVALEGDYAPLVPLLSSVQVGTLVLELYTPRAGDLKWLRALPDDRRVGVGVVNPKTPQVESLDAVVAAADKAVRLFGPERVLLNPDCGFATFADNPVASVAIAQQKLATIVQAARVLRQRYDAAP